MPQNNTVQLVETIKKWRNMVPKCSKVRCCTSLQAASSGSNQSARFMAGARPEPWMSVDVNGCQWQNRGCRSSGVVSTDLSKKDPENPVVYHLRSRFRQQRGNFRVSHLIIILSMEIWGQWSRYGLCMHTLRRDRDASVARFCAKYAPVGNLTITHHTYKVGPPSYKMVYKPH